MKTIIVMVILLWCSLGYGFDIKDYGFKISDIGSKVYHKHSAFKGDIFILRTLRPDNGDAFIVFEGTDKRRHELVKSGLLSNVDNAGKPKDTAWRDDNIRNLFLVPPRFEYEIIGYNDMFRVERAVNDKLKDGWKCQGGLSIYTKYGRERWYFQAIVREKKQ